MSIPDDPEHAEIERQAMLARIEDCESALVEAELVVTELVQAVQQTAEELTDARKVIEAICRNLPVRVDSADFKLIRAIGDRERGEGKDSNKQEGEK